MSVTQQMLVQFVKGQFPVKRDADENKGMTLSMSPISRDLTCALPAFWFGTVKQFSSRCACTDPAAPPKPAGQDVEERQCLAMRDTLLKRYREDIAFPPNFLDQVLHCRLTCSRFQYPAHAQQKEGCS